MNIIRWILAIPFGILGWFIALMLGIALHELAIYACPKEQLLSGMCVAEWFKSVRAIIMYFSFSIAAVLVVLLPTIIAPRHKLNIAIIAYIIGAIFALYTGIVIKEWFMAITALFIGLISVIFIYRFNQRQLHA